MYRLPDGLANLVRGCRMRVYVLAGASGTQTVKVDQRQAARGDWVSARVADVRRRHAADAVVR